MKELGEAGGLRVTGLTVERGGRDVIADLSFELGCGQALVLMGPNGAGKTTLIRAIAGLLPLKAGEIAMSGGGAEERFSEACHYVGHSNATKPELTVAENLRFWARFLRDGGSDEMTTSAGDGVETAMRSLGLAALADIPLRYLSAGQQRRVAIARLLVARRPVWLLDEPTASLDAANTRRLIEIGDAHIALGGMIIAATHLPLGFAVQQELRLEPVDLFYAESVALDALGLAP